MDDPSRGRAETGSNTDQVCTTGSQTHVANIQCYYLGSMDDELAEFFFRVAGCLWHPSLDWDSRFSTSGGCDTVTILNFPQCRAVLPCKSFGRSLCGSIRLSPCFDFSVSHVVQALQGERHRTINQFMFRGMYAVNHVEQDFNLWIKKVSAVEFGLPCRCTPHSVRQSTELCL